MSLTNSYHHKTIHPTSISFYDFPEVLINDINVLCYLDSISVRNQIMLFESFYNTSTYLRSKFLTKEYFYYHHRNPATNELLAEKKYVSSYDDI